MSFLVTKPAPDFTATAVLADNSFDEGFRLSSLHGKYVILFFYPLDFTFVCPTEILAFDEALEDFHSRDAEVVGVSVDSHFTHAAWKRTNVASNHVRVVPDKVGLVQASAKLLSLRSVSHRSGGHRETRAGQRPAPGQKCQ